MMKWLWKNIKECLNINIKPNDWHGGVASKNGGAFISIQHWLNGVKPTHVGADWQGEVMGQKHLDETIK